jgi:hypothetical protein
VSPKSNGTNAEVGTVISPIAYSKKLSITSFLEQFEESKDCKDAE